MPHARSRRPLVLALALALPGLAFASGYFAEPSAAQPPPMCQATLAVGRVSVRAGCTIDERVSGRRAVLSYPCRGGAAVAAFGESVFRGDVDARGEVNVVIQTRFPFSDGCTWETKQRIQGNLTSRQLAYEYSEQPLAGQHGCANGCLGTATVQVSGDAR